MAPDTWQVMPLADICDEKISYGIVQAGPHVEDGVPYIKSSDLNSELKLEDLQRTAVEIHNKYIRSTVRPGDIIFSLRGNIGLCRIVPTSIPEANLTQGTARISVKPEYSTEFFLQQITGPELNKSIQAKAKGSTFQEISLEALRKVPVLVPPKAEQTKIAQILSTWDKAIATTERLLVNSQQQKQALMQQLLTGQKRFASFSESWEETTLGKICKPQQWPTISSSQLIDSGYRVFGANGFIGYFNEFNHAHETVAVTCRGSTCGEVSLIPEKSYITGNSMCLDDINPNKHDYTFIYFLLCLRGFRDVISGSAQPQIVGNAIKTIQLSIPSLPEQQKIAQVLSTADAEITNLQAQLAALKLEKKALMQQLLTGQRRVKPDAEAAA